MGSRKPTEPGRIPCLSPIFRSLPIFTDVDYNAAVGLFRIGTPKARKVFRRHVR